MNDGKTHVIIFGGMEIEGSSIQALADIWYSDDFEDAEEKTHQWKTYGSDFRWGPRYDHTALKLHSGKVLIMFGRNKDGKLADLYKSNKYEGQGFRWQDRQPLFSVGHEVKDRRASATAVVLSTGAVVVMGGLQTN